MYTKMHNAAGEKTPSGSPQLKVGPSETLVIRYVNHNISVFYDM